ncbi:hypothetical protein BDR05DRAFT_999336 [Suillus weaverae]|nr:hypothetical protein BDR05DRAFT_999336 [Suillus weaverae]
MLRMCQASGPSPLENILQLSSAVVIIFEHSYFISDKRRHLRDQQKSGPSFYVALDQYTASPHATVVRKSVGAAVQAFEEAVRIAAHTRHGNLPSWMTKLPFQSFKRKTKEAFEPSQAKAELIKAVLEISLKHRLQRP